MAVGTVLFGESPSEVQDHATYAERRGLQSVWTGEFYDRSAIVPLACMARATSSIRVGSAVLNARGRSPLTLFTEALDIARLAPDRFSLGIGFGSKRIQRDWFGAQSTESAARLAEYVNVLRLLWDRAGRRVEFHGRHYALDLRPSGSVALPGAMPPILIGAVRPGLLKVAARLGDGVITHPVMTPEYLLDVVRPLIDSERDQSRKFKVLSCVLCAVGTSEAPARAAAACHLAFEALSHSGDPVFHHHGVSDVISVVRDRLRSGDIEGMISAGLPLVDTFAIAGTTTDVQQRLLRWTSVADEVLLYPPTFAGTQHVPGFIRRAIDAAASDTQVGE